MFMYLLDVLLKGIEVVMGVLSLLLLAGGCLLFALPILLLFLLFL